MVGLKIIPLSHSIGSKTKTSHDSLPRIFPRFFSARVFASCFDRSTRLSVSFVIGQCD